MLEEYAIVPDVFNPLAYSKPEYADMCLAQLKSPLLHEALVRDLRDGAWSRFCLGEPGLHRLAGELLRKLATRNRLCRCTASGAGATTDATAWGLESLATASVKPLTGVIVGNATKVAAPFSKDARVASIEKLSGTNWWKNPCSQTVPRRTTAYLSLLARVLAQANSLMFVDPNLDPSSRNYKDFYKLLAPLGERQLKPRVEIHRSLRVGDGRCSTFPEEPEWKHRFSSLNVALCELGLTVEVFFWDDFHDRYLITDVIGLSVQAGFDTTTKEDDITTWGRLSSDDRDAWQRHFDPAVRSGALKSSILIGVNPSNTAA